MSPLSFCYWLQGFFELQKAGGQDLSAVTLNGSQILEIQNHLKLVFNKETPVSFFDTNLPVDTVMASVVTDYYPLITC